MRKIIGCISLFILFVSFASSQDTTSIEKDLLKSYSSAYYWTLHSDLPIESTDEDSLEKANDQFQSKLLYCTANFPQTLNALFAQLQHSINIITSDNGLFRIYSWDDNTGNMMRNFRNVFQYKSLGKVKSTLLPHRDTISEQPDDILNYYSRIYTLYSGRHVYYLATFGQIISSHVFVSGIKVFSLENGVLNDTVHLIKTKTGIRNELQYSYENNEKSSDHILNFNKETNTIYIPLVDDVTVTDRYIKYKFTGTYFEKVEGEK